MEDAYTIGIRLALEDGVSAGIAAIGGDLATLDRAVAATTGSLARLGALGNPATHAAAAEVQRFTRQAAQLVVPPALPATEASPAPTPQRATEPPPVAPAPAAAASPPPVAPPREAAAPTQAAPQAVPQPPAAAPVSASPAPVSAAVPPPTPISPPVAPTALAGFAPPVPPRDLAPPAAAAPSIDLRQQFVTNQAAAASLPIAPAAPPASAPLPVASQLPVPTAPLEPRRTSVAPPPPAQASGGPTQGDVYLDGMRVGRWMSDNLAREATRPQAGSTAFDPRIGAAWPGTLQGS